MQFSVIIPVYNEERSLRILQEGLFRVMEGISSQYEIIYVDDGSTDSSLEVLKDLARNYSTVKIISLKENKGQSTALYVGLKSSQGEWMVILDADGQNPPEEIIRLLEFQNGFDFITGIRVKNKHCFIKRVASFTARFFRRLILADITKDAGCSLKIFKREIVDFLPFFNHFHRFFTFFARQAGFNVKEVYVAHHKRIFGRSKYGISKRLRQGLFDLIGVYWLKKRLIHYEVRNKF